MKRFLLVAALMLAACGDARDAELRERSPDSGVHVANWNAAHQVGDCHDCHRAPPSGLADCARCHGASPATCGECLACADCHAGAL